MSQHLRVEPDDASRTVRVLADRQRLLLAEVPVRWATLAGAGGAVAYERMRHEGDSVVGVATVDDGRVVVTDEWRARDGRVELVRRIEARSGDPLRVDLELVAPGADRYLVPGMISAPAQHARRGRYTFADDRLGYPVVAGWEAGAGRVSWLARTSLATVDSAPVRRSGDRSFVRDTDLGHVGFRTDRAAYLAGWPVAELDRSSQLDASGIGFESFHSREDDLVLEISYELGAASAASFADATRIVTARAVELADPSPTRRALGLRESIGLRLDSAAKTYAETDSGFAGFVLNFDPERGYDAQAKAFGASFADHEMGGSHDILEYGFTGRQLDIAASLVERDPDAWAERGRRVVDSFVGRLAHESGWMATLFDLAEDRPLFAVGDARGSVMHYLGRSELAGTYTRMMTEAGSDLLRSIRVHRALGHDTARWEAAALGLARFLVRVQNADGSWYRAYAPDGRPIVGDDWFGDVERTGKSATAAVVPYLLAAVPLAGDAGGALADAARRAGSYVQEAATARAEYRGGTLDNPNDVDKEAAFLAMRALLALEEAGVEGDWRDAAVQAAWFALGWHSLWPVPNVPATPVAEAGVRSVGWGGINSVWGVGVTDIYSLFFAGELHRLGVRAGVPEFVRVAELIAHSSLELLSAPGRLHGFADTGMQPEGISFCDQGRDDGLITKGATWGGLGWPYTAGTTGLADYLDACDDARD
ncbi:MAG: hypothetical protein QM598_09465 [Protaetiibacter sp.]